MLITAAVSVCPATAANPGVNVTCPSVLKRWSEERETERGVIQTKGKSLFTVIIHEKFKEIVHKKCTVKLSTLKILLFCACASAIPGYTAKKALLYK